ncbi:MAG: redoxin domain-containing protein [Melioribacteraceae bacterium]|nr:redoxin domain-containing protein [Melioribacteraceae bacterium]
MKNKIQFLIILLLLNIGIYSQSIVFSINNTNSKTASLYSLSGERLSFIDSITASSTGQFSFTNENLHTGFYRLSFDKHKAITFLNDGNDIEITADADNIAESLQSVNSKSNKLYYEFVNLNKDYKTKSELLQLILSRYPKNDDYYDLTKQKLNELQYDYLKFVNGKSQKDPESFIARYIKSSQLPVVSNDLQTEEQLEYLKKHSLDNVNFNDDELINTDCFTNKSIEYLTYFRNPQLPLALLEKEFEKAVDTLLTKASVNIFVYQHVADYLVDGFKKFGFDNVVDYIIENYVVKDDLCLDEQTENSLQNRINQSKLLSIGSKAPNIILPDEKGNEVNLANIKSNRILLIFYASWCPHCKDLLPAIHKLYKEKKSFEVVAVSLDEKKEDWIKFISDNKLDWINISDLKGWESKAGQDYYIYATPTMFMLDSELNIISKPMNLEELKKE